MPLDTGQHYCVTCDLENEPRIETCRDLLEYYCMNIACCVSMVIVLINRYDEVHDAEYEKYSVQSVAKLN